MAGAGGFAFDETLGLCRRLWAAAEDLESYVKTRDELAEVARKHWTGPHQVTFARDLSVDMLLEESSANDLEEAAKSWAHAWVLAMNAENEHLENQAIKEVGGSAPGESFVEEIPEVTPITRTPEPPGFEPTGGFYTPGNGNWATEGSSGGGSFGDGHGECEWIPDDDGTEASASPADLQEFVDGSQGIESLFGPTIDGTQEHWRFVLNMAGEFTPADLKNPLFDCEDVIDAWKDRREFVTDVRSAFIEADSYDPDKPDNVLTVPVSAIDRQLRDNDGETEFEAQAEEMIEQTAKELGVSEKEAERILVDGLNEPVHGEKGNDWGPSIGDQAGGSDGDPATLAEILEAIDDGRIIIPSQTNPVMSPSDPIPNVDEPTHLIDPSGNSPEAVAEYLRHQAVTDYLLREYEAKEALFAKGGNPDGKPLPTGDELEADRLAIYEREVKRRELEEEHFGVPIEPLDYHAALDLLGIVPVYGEIADGLNGVLYLNEGNYVDAGMSFGGLIPIGGQAITGKRIIREFLEEKASKKLLKSVKDNGGEVVEIITDGDTVTYIIKQKDGSIITATETPGRPLEIGHNARKDADGNWQHTKSPKNKGKPEVPFKPPNKRHQANPGKNPQIKDTNTVRGPSVDYNADMEAINSGQATRIGNEWHVNGRIYGDHGPGTALFPIGGKGLTQLSRIDYKAYVEINRVNGDASKANPHVPGFTPDRLTRMAELWKKNNP